MRKKLEDFIINSNERRSRRVTFEMLKLDHTAIKMAIDEIKRQRE